MSTLKSRLYSWATDKTNNVKITAARMDAENDQIITALNQKVLCAASAPDSPIAGQSWYDTTNKILKIYRNNEWVSMGGLHVATTAPSNPIEGDLWYETDTDLLKAYNGSAWVEFPISIDSFTEKTTLVADDLFLIEDSEATNAKKKVKQSNIVLSGSVIQYNSVSSSAAGTGTALIPYDDTDPNPSNEGTNIAALNLTLVPRAVNNIIEIKGIVHLAHSADSGQLAALLWKNTDTTTLGVFVTRQIGSTYPFALPIRHKMVATSTGTITFKVNIGSADGGTVTINGFGGARKYGGKLQSWLEVMEIKP